MHEKVPPNDVNLERSVLADMILHADSCETGLNLLKPGHFYYNIQKKIFSAIQTLHNKSGQVDLPLLAACMRESGQLEEIGGPSYLSIICDEPLPANIESHADKLKDFSVRRELITAVHNISEAVHSSHGKSAVDVLEAAQKAILNIQISRPTKFSGLSDLVMDATERYEKLSKQSGITGIPSGFVDLDKMTAGFQDSDLIIIAARPSMGKTALASNLAINMAKNGHAVFISSLEMSKGQLVDRIFAAESGVNVLKFRNGNFDPQNWKSITNAGGRLYDLPVIIDDSPAISYMELMRQARQVVSRERVKAIFVDYLGLMVGEKGLGRTEEVSSITRNLKGMAKELNIPVIALSQLNRSLENRDNKRPKLSDLRDSGSIEQDADVVLFIYRDFVYHPKTADPEETEIIISKHRNGPSGTIKLRWNKYITKFQN